MVLAENGFLLILGLTLGGVSALFAVAPHVLTSPESVPYLSLSLILLLALVVGMLASSAADSAAAGAEVGVMEYWGITDGAKWRSALCSLRLLSGNNICANPEKFLPFEKARGSATRYSG